MPTSVLPFTYEIFLLFFLIIASQKFLFFRKNSHLMLINIHLDQFSLLFTFNLISVQCIKLSNTSLSNLSRYRFSSKTFLNSFNLIRWTFSVFTLFFRFSIATSFAANLRTNSRSFVSYISCATLTSRYFSNRILLLDD